MNQPDNNAVNTRERDAVRIGEWILHPDLGMLWKSDNEVRLNNKALQTLLVLIDAGERGVSRDKLLERVWGSSYPSDYVVSRAIADLRAAFGEKAGEEKYIRTLPKYGYQLLAKIGPVEKIDPSKHYWAIWGPRYIAYGLGIVVLLIALWPRGQYRIAKPAPTPLTAAPGLEHQPRFSPDGEWVIYAALKPQRSDWDLFRVSLASGESQPVAVSQNVAEHGPAFSPQGNEVAYVRMQGSRCDVVIQAVALGAPRPVAACTMKFPSLVDWSPNGDWLAYTASEADDVDNYRRIHVFNTNTGESRMASTGVSPTGSDFYPRFSPDSSNIAFLRGEPQPDHRSTLWIVDAETNTEQALTSPPAQIGGMAWVDDNRLMYSVLESGRMQMHILKISGNVARDIRLEDVLHPDINRVDGSLVAAKIRRDMDLAILDVDGTIRSVAISTYDDHHGRFSPDGQWLSFVSSRNGHEEIWLASSSGDAVRKLTDFGGVNVRYPGWRSGGQAVIFSAQGETGEQVYSIDLISGNQQQLPIATPQATTPSFLPSGNGYVYGCLNEGRWGICVSKGGSAQKFVAPGYFQPQAVNDAEVLAVNTEGVLHRLSLADGTSEEIWDGLPLLGRTGWALQGDDLYFIANAPGGNGRIFRRNLASGATEQLYEGEMPVADTTLSVNPQTGALLFTRFQAASDDLVIYEGVRF